MMKKKADNSEEDENEKSNKDKTINDLLERLNKQNEENGLLNSQLDFALDMLDKVFGYLNHFSNMIFHSNDNLPLHKFNKDDMTNFLQNMEGRLFDLLDKERKLDKLKNPNPILDPNNKNYNGTKELEIKMKFKDSVIDDLTKENARLKDEIKRLQQIIKDNNLGEMKKKFLNSELEQQLVIDFQVLSDENAAEVIDEFINPNDDDDQVGQKAQLTLDKKSSNRTKYKKIVPGNMYDKYSEKPADKFFSGLWAGDGYTSTFVETGKGKKFIHGEITDKLNLDKKHIIPPKKKTYAFLLNKKEDNVSKEFIRKETNKVEKHNFE